MKKNYSFLFATAVLVLTGCSQDEVLNEVAQKDQAIEFSTYAGRPAESRATSYGSSNKVPDFGVFGYYTGQADWDFDATATPNLMNNQKVALSAAGNSYEYSPIKYWPNNTNDKVSFYAYAPWTADASLAKNTDGGVNKLVLDFTVDETVKNQKDFLYSTDAQETFNMTKPNVTGKVTFTFAHALSRIGFSAEYAVDEVTPGDKVLDANTTINIKSVTLADENGNALFYKSAKLYLTKVDNEFTAEWGGHSTTDNITKFELTNDNENFKKTDGHNYPALTETVDKIDQLNADDSYIMIIPQNLQSTNLKITIVYDVVTKNPEGSSNNDNANAEFSVTNTISKTLTGFNFEMGKAYTFNLILGMTSVKVDASVVNWDETTTSQDVDLPKNTENTGA